jgi:hypothetical protein
MAKSMKDRNTQAAARAAAKLAECVPLRRLPTRTQTNGHAHRFPRLSLNFLVDFSDEAAGKGGMATGGLSGATVARLRSVLSKHIERPDEADPELALVLRQVVTEARSRQIRAEQLVVSLKHVWDSLPEARYAIDREAQAVAKQRLITLCIRVYYRG